MWADSNVSSVWRDIIPRLEAHTWKVKSSKWPFASFLANKGQTPKPRYQRCQPMWQGHTYALSVFITTWKHCRHIFLICILSRTSLHLTMEGASEGHGDGATFLPVYLRQVEVRVCLFLPLSQLTHNCLVLAITQNGLKGKEGGKRKKNQGRTREHGNADPKRPSALSTWAHNKYHFWSDHCMQAHG